MHNAFSLSKTVIYWLYVIAFLIIMMVVIGGLTRLTGSGLSITVWKPIIGAIPPLSLDQWHQEFLAYQKIPQYIQHNAHMTLDEFKVIYWWEWGHRQLGRMIGLVFIVPFLWFLYKGKVPTGYKKIFLFLFLGGAFQGFLGWFMVASGLTERTEVSQYRLALHLGFALLLYVYTIMIILCLKEKKPFSLPRHGSFYIVVLSIFLQILSGAFMAGTHAGYTYNTWPLLDHAFIPDKLFPDGFRSFFEDHLTIQFFHRMGAYYVFIISIFFYIKYKKNKNNTKNKIFLLSILCPLILGIITLITVAPIHHIYIASLHQISAVFLLTMGIIWHWKK